MEGKTIVKVLELGESIVLLKMSDDSYISAKIIDPEIPAETVEEFFEDEAPAKPAKEEKKATKKEETKEEADDELDWDQINEMSLKALKKVITEKDLLVDADDFDEDLPGLKEAIAEELDIEVPKAKAKKEEKKEEKTDDDDYTWQDLVAMDFEELTDLVKENKLDTDPDDFDEDTIDALRRAIAKECDIEAPAKKKK